MKKFQLGLLNCAHCHSPADYGRKGIDNVHIICSNPKCRINVSMRIDPVTCNASQRKVLKEKGWEELDRRLQATALRKLAKRWNTRWSAP